MGIISNMQKKPSKYRDIRPDICRLLKFLWKNVLVICAIVATIFSVLHYFRK